MTTKYISLKRKGLIILLCFSLILFTIFICITTRCGSPIKQLPQGVYFQNGDIILLGSSTFRGRILRFLGRGEEWAHVGLLTTNVNIEIIHADPDAGVIKQTLSEYLITNNVDALALRRTTKNGSLDAINYAEQAVLANAPFNHSFRYKSDEGFYCTELVLLAWENAGVVLLPTARYGDRILPSALLQSSKLKCIWQLRTK